MDRRTFLTATAGIAAGPVVVSCAAAPRSPRRVATTATVPCIIASGGHDAAVNEAMRLLQGGADPADAIVAGVTMVEDDPNVMSVGYGGLPNEHGIVELDASVMHGPTHKAGSVAGIRNIKNPARVALHVLRRTDHVMLVGDGARQFAVDHGFKEENLLTDKARERWMKWKRNLSPRDDLLDDDQRLDGLRAGLDDEERIYGTVHFSAVDANGAIASCTSTSGLSYKLAGRVGDSPIIGAGMFCDNDVGAAGATGRGESVIQACGSFQVVHHMGNDVEPTEACLKALQWMADHTRRHDLLNERGEPNFNVTFYAVRKDGAFGAASMRGRHGFTIHNGTEARRERGAALFA